MITKFFYKLLRSKEPSKRVIGYLYFAISGEYYNFVREITKYYPFSLFYKDRLFHAANKPYSDFMWDIEGTAKKNNVDIKVWNGHGFGETAEFYGTFKKRVANKDLAKINLEKILQEKFGTVYVRDNPKGFKVLVPMSLIVQN